MSLSELVGFDLNSINNMSFPDPPECKFSEDKNIAEKIYCLLLWTFWIVGTVLMLYVIIRYRHGLQYNRKNPKKEPDNQEILPGLVPGGSDPIIK